MDQLYVPIFCWSSCLRVGRPNGNVPSVENEVEGAEIHSLHSEIFADHYIRFTAILFRVQTCIWSGADVLNCALRFVIREIY